MKEEKKDSYDIKKFAEVLDESKMMVPDSENRLKRSIEELTTFMKDDVFSEIPEDNEWIAAANVLIAEHA